MSRQKSSDIFNWDFSLIFDERLACLNLVKHAFYDINKLVTDNIIGKILNKKKCWDNESTLDVRAHWNKDENLNLTESLIECLCLETHSNGKFPVNPR